jgi:hypothetical protein
VSGQRPVRQKENLGMIGWNHILYGAALSALFAAAALTAATRPRRPAVILTGALAAGGGPIAWNAILRAAHGSQFFTDAPIAVLPASWQDTGSGVFTVAAAALALASGPLATTPARRVALLACLCGLVAFLVDVYLY